MIALIVILNSFVDILMVILTFIIILGSLIIGLVGVSVKQWELGFRESSSAFAGSLVDLSKFVWVFVIRNRYFYLNK